MTDTRQHILALTPEELTAQLAALKMPKFRTKQIHEWIFEKRATSFDDMTNLGLADRMMLAETFVIFRGELVQQQRSADGTEKILLRWPDGGTTETVMIPSDDDQCDEFG